MAFLAAELFANDLVDSTLASSITSGATSLTLTTGQGSRFPAAASGVAQFRVRVDDELMICTARSGDVLTVTRGVEGTTAAAHNAAAVVKHVLTADALERFVSEYLWHPRDNDFLAWSSDPATVGSSAAIGTTAVWLTRIKVPEAIQPASIATYVSSAGSSVTSLFMALFDKAGTRLAITAQQSTAFNSTGYKEVAFTSTPTIVAGPGEYVYGAITCVAATTAPTLVRPAQASLANIGIVNDPDLRGASVSSGGAMPSSVTVNSLTAQNPFWMALL